MSVRVAFVGAAEAAISLLREGAVAEAWDQPSALPKMSVGALACHVAEQLYAARDLLAAPERPEEPIPLLEHYARADWVEAGLDDEPNTSVRDACQEDAEAGPKSMLVRALSTYDELVTLLAKQPESRAVHVPWQGWSLSMDDFLVTRMMEIVVHSDDLAVSVHVEPPEFADEVLAPVLALLTGVSARRHGQAAVVRALSRAERAPQSIAAF